MLPNSLQRTIAKPFRWLMCASLSAALVACGGGGGNASTPVTGGDAKVATVTLTTSATSMPSSGAVGTEVTLTATVKDAGNNALAGVTVSFSASSGSVSTSSRVTDANGVVTEKLSTGGDTTARTITVTASAGGKNSNSKDVEVKLVTPVAPKLLLTSSAGKLDSAGSVGSEVEIRALVIDTNNVVVPGATVTFVTDSGTLSAAQAITSATGIATVKLGTGSDPTTRVITVTATSPGVTSTVTVNVEGTKLSLNAPMTVNVGPGVEVTAVLVDSLGNPLVNKPVTFGVVTNSITKAGGGASPAMTDAGGKVVLTYLPTNAVAKDVITVSALGQTTTKDIAVLAANFTIKAVDATNTALISANTEVCHKVAIANFLGAAAVGGGVTVSSSRGFIYTDAACTAALGGGKIALAAGLATAYVKADSPGNATLSATSDANSSTVTGAVEFVAPLTSTAVISLQASPATIGVNTPTTTTQQSVLRAVVMDKASQGNPVKNARIAFGIVTDPSGGTLSQPTEILTGPDGAATVTYIAGTTSTAVEGVVVQAQIIGSALTSVKAQAKMTVAQRALFISAGTGNTILTPNSSTYQVDYSVFVTDAAGNAVSDVSITASVRPRDYRKGRHFLVTASGPWAANTTVACLNEDIDSDGNLGALEDTNHNGRLDPVIPVTITSNVKTGADGRVVVSMAYPKDRAHWMAVDFTIRGQVAGSEARYVGYTVLAGLSTDYLTATITPPGYVSPYGESSVCTDEL